MFNYLVRRLLSVLPILLGISLISFAMMHLSPGKPAVMTMDPTITAEARERQLEALGLNEPLPLQYIKWIGGVVKGDFGLSYTERRPVMDMILERLPNTLLLMLVATILAILVSIPLGIIQARKRGSGADYGITVASFAGLALPNFWFGLMLLMLFSVQLGWTPVGGVATLGGDFSILDRLHHLILPALVLATSDTAALTRYTRSSMMDVLNQDYIRTARAKGLVERTVVYKHGLRNGLIPIVTIFALMLPTMIGGSVVVETIFSWPGIGRLFISAVFQRDYPVVMAITMIGALLTVMGNLLADICYALLDPRIEY